MASKIKVDQLETADGSGTIALQNQLSGLASASMPSGSVLKVVQTGSVSRTTVSSTGSWTSCMDLSITPSSTNSKILIMFVQGTRIVGSTPMRGGFRIERGSTNIWNTDESREQIQVRDASNEVDMMVTGQYLDSPNTTSSTTYTLQWNMLTGTTTYLWESGRGTNMTLMEIAG